MNFIHYLVYMYFCSIHISIYLKWAIKCKINRVRKYGFYCFTKDIFDYPKEIISNQTFERIRSLLKTVQTLLRATMWNSHIFFSFIILIQNTCRESSLTHDSCFLIIIDRQTNNICCIYIYISSRIFLIFFLLLLYCLFNSLLFTLYLFSFSYLAFWNLLLFLFF
jgi:hypothetical protein